MKKYAKLVGFALMLAVIAFAPASCGGSGGANDSPGGSDNPGGGTTTWLTGRYMMSETEGYGHIVFSGSSFTLTIMGTEYAAGTYTITGDTARFRIERITNPAVVKQYDIDIYEGETHTVTIVDENTLLTDDGNYWPKV